MKMGTLVRFTVSMYSDWGFGIILREKPIVDRDGRNHTGFYEVFTANCGEKVVSKDFFEVIS